MSAFVEVAISWREPVIGTAVSHYRVLSQLGSGGMGVVYLAEDLRLKRKVALKFLKTSGSAHPEARLLREAQAASTLDHPNVATIYEIGDWNGQPFIAMAYVPGETLQARLRRGPMALREIVELAGQMASGLAAAHAMGVVHRDLKPANVVIGPSGQLKILDFGLAKFDSPDHETMTRMTDEGTTVGTLAYMSPEQAKGLDVDHRADIWALGAVIYEMLAGRPPYEERTVGALILALASTTPAPVRSFRADAPTELERVLARALERDPSKRTIAVGEIRDELQAISASLASTGAVAGSQRHRGWRRAALWLLVILTVAAAVAYVPVTGWLNRRWAMRTALPEARRLAGEERYIEALAVARDAERHVPGNPDLGAVLAQVTRPITIETNPPGALVSYTAYGGVPAWQPFGETPIRDRRTPKGLLRWRIEMAGFNPFEDAIEFESPVEVDLATARDAPAGMVRVIAPRVPMQTVVNGGFHTGITFRDFWIDRREVTNRQFAAFVDAGGYRNPAFWKHPFVTANAKVVSWVEAMTHFRDQTGRPGPAAWVLGRYVEGQEAFPVTGISWYEAAAYSAFAGKDLPTLFQWNHVAGFDDVTAAVVPLANFAGRGIRPTAESTALHRFGAYDLAGNVKEWAYNESSPGHHYLLGGAWDEPAYLFGWADARSAWDRQPNFGFRCVRYDADDTSVAPLRGLIAPPSRDYSRETPVNDELFRAYARAFSYDRTPVESRIEASDDTPSEWTRQTVSFPAAYGSERVQVHVFLPKRTQPPFQTVVFTPGADAVDLRNSRAEVESPSAGFVIRSGRALVLPIYRGTYERSSPAFRGDTPRGSNAFRDHAIDWYKDLARTIDYLETRRDIAADKLAYVGVSRGAALAPVFLALEQRFKAAALFIPGFYADTLPPEIDVLNFAPRMKTPVLVLGGHYDFLFPEKALQEPFFQALGAPTRDKRRVMYNTGHNLPRNEMIKETLGWLDKYLGPIE